MTNVYDIAHELVRSLKETDQYKDYKEVKARVDANEGLSGMIKDFQEQNMKLQTSVMMGEEPSDELKQKLQQLYAVVMSDPLAAEYMQKEMLFTQVFSEIYNIIAEAAKFE